MNYKQLISYDDKTALYSNSNIPAENKVQDTDMNNIKNVVNGIVNGTNILGNIVVDSIHSKNILDVSGWSTQTVNGITFTNNGDGSITINGTANASFGISLAKPKLKANTTYYMTIGATTPTAFYIYDYDSNSGVLNTNTATTMTQDYNNVGFDTYISNGTQYDNITIYPMIIEGSEATPFVPYQNLSGYDIYSGEEMKVGTWIDGRTLYRNVFNISNISSSNQNLIDLSSIGIQDIIYLHGFVKANNGSIFTMPFTDSSSNYNVLYYNGQYLTGRCVLSGGATVSSAYAIIEYTKTTN